jgi:hypothetical protein
VRRHGDRRWARGGEEIDYGGWDASFTEVSPSIQAWLEGWVQQPMTDVAEEVAKEESFMARAAVEEARRSREIMSALMGTVGRTVSARRTPQLDRRELDVPVSELRGSNRVLKAHARAGSLVALDLVNRTKLGSADALPEDRQRA